MIVHAESDAASTPSAGLDDVVVPRDEEECIPPYDLLSRPSGVDRLSFDWFLDAVDAAGFRATLSEPNAGLVRARWKTLLISWAIVLPFGLHSCPTSSHYESPLRLARYSTACF